MTGKNRSRKKLTSPISIEPQSGGRTPPGSASGLNAPNKAQDFSVEFPVRNSADLTVARQQGRSIAAQMGFGSTDLVIIECVISELARNIVVFAGAGRITLSRVREGAKLGIQVIAADNGPGIADLDRVLQYGYSIGGGLPRVKRVMDRFEISSKPGVGTTVSAVRWLRSTNPDYSQ